MHTLASTYDQVIAISYDERIQWHTDAIYEVTVEEHFPRGKVVQYFGDQMCANDKLCL